MAKIFELRLFCRVFFFTYLEAVTIRNFSKNVTIYNMISKKQVTVVKATMIALFFCRGSHREIVVVSA